MWTTVGISLEHAITRAAWPAEGRNSCDIVVYTLQEGMRVERTLEFDDWLRRLRDRVARNRILARIDRIANRGIIGDWKSVGSRVRELRIDYGPGYRIYFV